MVALRHPLLDGDTHTVLVRVPIQERMRSGKHSAIGRDIGLEIHRRPFGPQTQICWTFVMSLLFLRALPLKAGLITRCWKGVSSGSSALRLDPRARLHSRVVGDAQKRNGCLRCVSALQSEALRTAYTPTDLVSRASMDDINCLLGDSDVLTWPIIPVGTP